MKTTLTTVLSVLLSTYAFAAPNYVDCTNTSAPMVEKSYGSQGFGIIYDQPENPVSVWNFIYSKQGEEAWANVIVGSKIYRATADCQQKINNGVLCVFDIENAKPTHQRQKEVAPLSDYVTRFLASVVDKNIAEEQVEVILGVDVEADPHQYSPTKYRNLTPLDNYWNNTCVGKDIIEQG